MLIHDGDGNEVADIELSVKQKAVLEAGEEIVVIYRTPQTMRHLIGDEQGTFILLKVADKTIVRDANVLRRYAKLQHAIKAVRRPA